jgi:hypothetical protein
MSWYGNLAKQFVRANFLNSLVGAKYFGIGAGLQTSDLNAYRDPYFQDGYRYNPADNRWYESPPAPDHGQWDWLLPAPPEKQHELNARRELIVFENQLEGRYPDNTTIWENVAGIGILGLHGIEWVILGHFRA